MCAKDIFPAFPSFKSWLADTVEQAMLEANIDFKKSEIEDVVDKNGFIKFTINDVPFTIKVE